jgi:Tfp pilus assembly protein PilO
MRRAFAYLRAKVDALSLAALVLLLASAAFYHLALKPLEERLVKLDRELERAVRAAAAGSWLRIASSAPAAKLEAFYRFFEREENAPEALAKLHGAALASGLTLRSGEYRLVDSAQRLERYRITLPVSGSYAQIRAFVETALAEIPVLALDQVSFRRKSANEARIEADVVLTLYSVRR